MKLHRGVRLALLLSGITYTAILLLLPVGYIIWRTLSNGVYNVWLWASTPAAISAAEITLAILCIIVPVNVVLGTVMAFSIVRWKIPGRAILDRFIDLPVAVSPVVVGVALIVLWGKNGWLYGVSEHIVPIIFSFPGMVLATLFVTFPFVARELIPVLEENGTDQETAAATLGANSWQIFRLITLPNISWALVYGVILSIARGLGEFGAVTLVSSGYPGIGMSMTMLTASRYTDDYNEYGAFVEASILMVLAVFFLIIMKVVQTRAHSKTVAPH